MTFSRNGFSPQPEHKLLSGATYSSTSRKRRSSSQASSGSIINLLIRRAILFTFTVLVGTIALTPTIIMNCGTDDLLVERDDMLIHLPLHHHDAAAADVVPSSKKKHQQSSSDWLLILTLNQAFFDFFLNWRHHYEQLSDMTSHELLLIAEDQDVYKNLLQLSFSHPTRVQYSGLNISDDQDYQSAGYKKMVSARPHIILEQLDKGRNVLYADTDAIWLKDPFPFLNSTDDHEVDFWAQRDTVRRDGSDVLCTGFLAIKANQKTRELVRGWSDALKDGDKVNQGAFNRAAAAGSPGGLASQVLPTEQFPSGALYFSYKFREEDRKNVVVVHNNHVSGSDPKRDRFKQYDLWHI